jgi:hypothetical protein
VRHLTGRLNEPLIKSLFSIISLSLSLSVFFSVASAQALGTRRLPENLPVSEPAKEPVPGPAPDRVARGNDLYCAGFINAAPTLNKFQIVGAEEENIQAHFTQGDVVYLNGGRAQGVEPDLLYTVVRPLGNFRSPFVHTSGSRNLGIYTRELGVLRVIAVHENHAVARIIFSCGDMQLGDLLRAFEERRAPAYDARQPLPRYEPPSGKTTGRIVLQRDQKEMLSPRDVVYIDLGKDNGVSVGDRFTIFRQTPDDANPVRYNDDDIVPRRSGGYQSDTFKGGTFSNDHPREERQRVKNARLPLPRKVVGELVVISVQGKSATAIITRTTQEVHTGDWVEAR